VLFFAFVRYQKISISKTVLPNPARWDTCLYAQQWLHRLTFDGNRSKQLYSVQPSCHVRCAQPRDNKKRSVLV